VRDFFSFFHNGRFSRVILQDFYFVFSRAEAHLSLSFSCRSVGRRRLHSFVREEKRCGVEKDSLSLERERERERKGRGCDFSIRRTVQNPTPIRIRKKKRKRRLGNNTKLCYEPVQRRVLTSFIPSKKNRNQSVPTAPVSTGTRSRTRTRRDICTGTNRITDAGGTREAIGEGD